jgi:hypothetical protein
MIKLTDIAVKQEWNEVTSDFGPIKIKSYLTTDEKVEFIQYVLINAQDQKTGSFSPLVLKTIFELALVKYYTDIEIDENLTFKEAYDILQSNGLMRRVLDQVPPADFCIIHNALFETAADMREYNRSFAGTIANASEDSDSLSGKLEEILTKIKNAEGLEQLSAIKDVVG